MPACSICSRSAKFAHMTLNEVSYNFCSQHCMDAMMNPLTKHSVLTIFDHDGHAKSTADDFKAMYPDVDILSFSKSEAEYFCKDVLEHYQAYCGGHTDAYKFIPTTWEESYIREACLPAVGKLPVITIDAAVPAIIKAFRNECEQEIPW